MLSNKEAPFTAVPFLDNLNTIATTTVKIIIEVFSLMPIESGSTAAVKNKEIASIIVVIVTLKATLKVTSAQFENHKNNSISSILKITARICEIKTTLVLHFTIAQ
ncbi:MULTISPECIES: hypothetical protein [Priestia]|uniref:hypothetical protein n=1 Tax=Priestia TaxID=2800373 RepID=UPI00114582A1|nr:hypothetical protein [Priestia aryabhattai]